ncbi:hypothetical protein M409DRAFT_50600 [Zasmidium cellare ATCC 36951]|uniref:C2H2-type domain-containing protein n=1 Tax=Zasmidium cellare ATCC 36951 TaxID=1080233 RepID=A0A6A6D1P1_ZASCE|nr:uncharacterized protein M409DRAFT_50600 [Zasmidium cellare ATCC 36951]KAF2171999.1 hypothetical protein M409DRAFT_50600 [Zasmidium cellare ATCC 36951]
METFTQEIYGLDKGQRCTKTQLPASVLRQLEQIAHHGIHPHLILQHYTAVFDQALTSPGQHQELSDVAPAPPPVRDETPNTTDREGHYGCPWCGSMIKLEKDFIRHVKEKCCPETVLRCPDCPKTYTRKHRLANHHKNVHPTRCGPGPCTHVSSATVKLTNTETLGCGFCPELVRGDLHVHRYLRHVIDHYREGAVLANWQAGHHIPFPRNARPFSPPPKIDLSASLENQGSLGDFSALRSGFGLDDSPLRSHSAISNDSTLFDAAEYTTTNAAAKANWDPYFNPTNMAFLHPMPPNNEPSMPQTFNIQSPEDDFGDMMTYINDYPDFINNTFIDTSTDDIIPQSQAVTGACAQLMDIGTAVEARSSIFNPTPPLQLTRDNRRSKSERLLRKFQSLSPLRTEF